MPPRSKGSSSKLAELVLGLSFLSLGACRSISGLISIYCCTSLKLFRRLTLARLRRSTKKEREMFKGPRQKRCWIGTELKAAAGVMMLIDFFVLFLFAETWSSLPFSNIVIFCPTDILMDPNSCLQRRIACNEFLHSRTSFLFVTGYLYLCTTQLFIYLVTGF